MGIGITSGQVIGLLGGSFDPAHEGHAHITRQALVRFGLGRCWWLVSPGNPLKQRGPAPLAARLARARQVMDHPRVAVTDIEAQLGTTFTAQTLRALMVRHRQARFIWLMGADNLAQFHHWQDWRWIMEQVPIGVLARPRERMSARTSVAARSYPNARVAPAQLATRPAPAWCMMNVPMVNLSSTAIREAGAWPS